MANTSPSQEPKKESVKEKLSSTLESFKKSEKLEGLYGYASSNTRDTLAYVLMIIGIVLMLFHPFYGGALIGLLGGFYFAPELVYIVQNISKIIDLHGMVRSLIAGGVFVGLFISAPAIFIGMAIAVALKQIIFPEEKKPNE
jgi:hypothetical protein